MPGRFDFLWLVILISLAGRVMTPERLTTHAGSLGEDCSEILTFVASYGGILEINLAQPKGHVPSHIPRPVSGLPSSSPLPLVDNQTGSSSRKGTFWPFLTTAMPPVR